MDAVEISLTSLGALQGLLLDANLALVVLAVPVPLVLQRLTGMGLFFQQADHDAKAGLLNFVAWTDAATRSLTRAVGLRGRPMLSWSRTWITHFKGVNDRYGHVVGDDVLRLAASTLRSGLRLDSLVARFGSQEFVLLLPAADALTGAAIADRLRVELAAQGVPVGDDVVRVTASFGVAATPGLQTLSELLSSADRAVYEAKRAGRNNVHVAEESQAPVAP